MASLSQIQRSGSTSLCSMELPALSQRVRRRLLVAALLGAGGYAAYRVWRDDARLRKAVRSTVAELQRAGEAALTRATSCVVAGTVQGIAAVRPQVRTVCNPIEIAGAHF